MTYPRFTIPVLAALAALLIALACMASGPAAAGNLPEYKAEQVDQILALYQQNGSAWIVIDPAGTHTAGEIFVVTAKTDLPAGRTVLVRTRPLSTVKIGGSKIEDVTLQNATVTQGAGGVNTISFPVDTAGFRESAYLLTLETSPETASAATWYQVTGK